MAVPELGQIRIIPDWFGYSIAIGQDIAVSGSGIQIETEYSEYSMLDHRTVNVTRINSAGVTGNHFRINAGTDITKKAMILFDGDNILNKDGKVQFQNDSTDITANTIETLNATHIGSGYYDADGEGLWGFETTTDQTLNGFRINENVGTFDGDIDIGICHMGVIYEMPTNAVASLSYNTEFQNSVKTSIGGASYSTLYNTNPKRILEASWEYINWSNGSSGIDDFTTMMGQSFGSHIPVALQLSQTGSVTADYFMFARISKWNQTQISPSLWKISATFEELI